MIDLGHLGRMVYRGLGILIVLVTGYYHLKLTQHKQKLNDLKLKLNEVKQDILSKQKQIDELQDEHKVVEVKVKRLNSQLNTLLSFMENHTVRVRFLSLIEFAEYSR